MVFDTPQFIQFISRTPTLKPLERATVAFGVGIAGVSFSKLSSNRELDVKILCRELDWQVSSLEQVCTSTLPHLGLSTLEDLYIYEKTESQPDWQDNVENTLWRELLRPFSDVKNLYLSEEFTLRIAPALQELVWGRTTEVLPALQNIFLEGLLPSGLLQKGILLFAAARMATGHPLAVSRWDRDRSRNY
jgi:hypothetical protein